MKQLSEVLPSMPKSVSETEQPSNILPMPQHGLTSPVGQLITISRLPIRAMPLTAQEASAIQSSMQRNLSLVELWKPITLEGSTRYRPQDYIYHYTGDFDELRRIYANLLTLASRPAMVKHLTVLMMHRPIHQATAERAQFLMADIADELGEVSEMALIMAIKEMKHEPSEETRRWFPMLGEIKTNIHNWEKRFELLGKSMGRPVVPEGYMRSGTLDWKLDEILMYENWHEKTFEETIGE